MLLYSHVWDLILKVAFLLALLYVAITLHIDESAGVLPMIVLISVVWLVIYRWGLSTLSAWLYARLTLGTNVSFAEARRLTRVFQLDTSGRWVAFSEVKKLPREQRHAALLAGLEAALPHRKAMLL